MIKLRENAQKKRMENYPNEKPIVLNEGVKNLKREMLAAIGETLSDDELQAPDLEEPKIVELKEEEDDIAPLSVPIRGIAAMDVTGERLDH